LLSITITLHHRHSYKHNRGIQLDFDGDYAIVVEEASQPYGRTATFSLGVSKVLGSAVQTIDANAVVSGTIDYYGDVDEVSRLFILSLGCDHTLIPCTSRVTDVTSVKRP
jgi:hypothetical protein